MAVFSGPRVDAFAKDLRAHVIRCELSKLDEKEKVSFDNAMKNVKEQIPHAMKVIEAEFRIILGVNFTPEVTNTCRIHSFGFRTKQTIDLCQRPTKRSTGRQKLQPACSQPF